MKNIGLKSHLILSGVFLLAILIFAIFHINMQPTPSLPALSAKASATAPRDYRLNINTASADELALLPGLGEKIAQRIVDYRNENGPFTEIDELTQVKGIKEALFNDLSDYITIGG